MRSSYVTPIRFRVMITFDAFIDEFDRLSHLCDSGTETKVAIQLPSYQSGNAISNYTENSHRVISRKVGLRAKQLLFDKFSSGSTIIYQVC